MSFPKTKMIDGVKYYSHGWANKRELSEEYAEKIRSKGGSARILEATANPTERFIDGKMVMSKGRPAKGYAVYCRLRPVIR